MNDTSGDPPSPPGRAGFLAFVEEWNASRGLATPEIHERMARWLEEGWTGRLRRRLLLAFRGGGKSTMVGLFCGWLLAREPDLRILVLAAEEALARKMVRSTRRMVERHPLAAGLKPQKAEQWAADQFTVVRRRELRDPSMLARGIAANITGSRAEVVICDDVEVPNTVSSPALRETLHERLSEIEYILVPGGLVLYAGTPHAYQSIYADARPDRPEERPFLDGYVRLALPAVGPDGRSAWPEVFPPERIEEVRRASGPVKFASQMLLVPVPDSAVRLDPERLRRYEDELDYVEANRQASLRLGDRVLVHGIGCWDPSFGRPTGDGSVIAAVFSDAEGNRYLHGLRWLNRCPDDPEPRNGDELARQCELAAAFIAEHHLPHVIVETNGIGRFVVGTLRRILAGGCTVKGKDNHVPKAERILDGFDAFLAARRLHVHRNVYDTPFIEEMREWRPGRSGRDDGLDAVSGCLVANPHPIRHHVFRLGLSQPSWRPGAGQYQAITEFKP